MKLFLPALLLATGTCSPVFTQINWQPTDGPEGGATWYIYYNDQYAFYPDEFNLYRSADGAHWEKLPHGNLWPIGCSPTTLAALQGYGFGYTLPKPRFVVSHDNGNSWTEGMRPPTRYGTFTSIAVCSHGIYVPDGHRGQIYRTQDDGMSWDSVPAPGLYCYDVWAFDDRLYAEWYSKFWRLSANGTDWELVSPPFGPQEYPNGMFASGSLLFFATENKIWSSNDYGITWHTKVIPFHNTANDFVQVGNRIYKDAGSTGLIYTDDQGVTWNEAPVPNDQNTLSIGTAGGKLLCATYNQGVVYLDENLNRLLPANSGLFSAAVYDLSASDTDLWAACGNGVFAYDLTDEVWTGKAPLPLPQYQYPVVAASKSGHIAALDLYSDRLYLSTNAGTSWDTIRPFAAAGGWGYPAMVYWLDDVLLVASDFDGNLRSGDLGQSWTFTAPSPREIVPFQGKYYGLAYGPTGLASSSDLGLSWQDEPAPNIPGKFALFSSGDRLFVIGQQNWDNTVLFTTADGTNWQYANDGLPAVQSWPGQDYEYQGNVWQRAGKYYLYQPHTGFFISLDSCKSWLPLQRNLFGHLELVDSTFYGGGFGGGVLKTGLPQNYGAISGGVVFKDDNNNGIREAGEIALPNVRVQLFEPNAWFPYWFVHTRPDGSYAIGSTPGTVDTLRVQLHSPYVENINPPLHIVNGSGNGRDFGVHFKADLTDVSVAGNYAGRPRPGFLLNIYLTYANQGTLPSNGSVSVKLDPHFQFTEADPPPTLVVAPDSLVWDFSQLALFERRPIRISGALPPSVPLGTLLKMYAYIAPDKADFAPHDNTFLLCDTVVGSFDPNEKHVVPAIGLTRDEIAAGEEFVYTILFQNTGTFPAERVRITDHLDTALDARTLRLVAASHPVTGFQLLPGGLLEIVFDHIGLPDSVSNEPESRGFVSFAIQRNKAFNPNYKIRNRAAIYFDFNEPVITNTVVTGLATPTVAVDEPPSPAAQTPSLFINPNPANTRALVSTDGKLTGPGEITISNLAGQICFRQAAAELASVILVDTALLADGMYVVRASGRAGSLTGKLMVQH